MNDNSGHDQFGVLLRKHRIRRGATQRQLADLSTVSVRAIRDLERGRSHHPRRDTVRLIADGLGLGSRERARMEAAANRTRTAGGLSLVLEAEPPAPLDIIVGREIEVAGLLELLRSGGQRLVTVTGAGGVGKTRLAMEVAGAVRNLGFRVLWNSADDGPARMRSTTWSDPVSVLPQSGQCGLTTSLDSALADLGMLLDEARPTVLVLDGHMAAQVRMDRVLALLREHRELRVLVTARAPFDVPGEQIFPLTPLAVPSQRTTYATDSFACLPSVRLLVHYVHQVQPGFKLSSGNAAPVAELCRLLDGIPAALQAVAAWFLVARPPELVHYVRTDPFGVASEKQPRLRETLYHALSFLDATEAAALDQLTVTTDDWSVTDAARLIGRSMPACAQMVRRLLMLGIIRPADGDNRTRFQVLTLIRALPGARISAQAV